MYIVAGTCVFCLFWATFAKGIDVTTNSDEFFVKDLKLVQKRTGDNSLRWFSGVKSNRLEVLSNDLKINLDDKTCIQNRKKTTNETIPDKVRFLDVAKNVGFTHLYRTHIAARPWCLFDFVVPSNNKSSKAAKLAGEFCIGEHVAGGAAVGDYDNDGLVDIFFTVFHGRSKLYKNKGDGTFTDVTDDTGVGPDKYANGAGWVDIDQDGDLDLYVTSLGNPRHFLYVNYGGHFKEEAIKRNVSMQFPNGRKLAGMTPNFGDFDNDGYPDIYVTEWILHSQGKPSASRLLRNLGEKAPGYFEDVTIRAGVQMDLYWNEHSLNAGTFTFGASFTDFDNDGFLELLITGDYGESKMFWNNGNGTFTECTKQCGLTGDVDAMGHAIGDINNDGYLEWFSSAIYDNKKNCEVSGCMFGAKGNKLFKNLGKRKFVDISSETGTTDGGWAWGSAFFDFDNNGNLDIVHTNGIDFPSTTVDDNFQKQHMRLFRNNGTMKKMENIAVESGMKFHGQGRGLLKFDYDDDGDEDVVVIANVGSPVLYKNIGGNRLNWLRVIVKNRCKTNINKLCESLGARVTVTDPSGRKQTQEIGSSTHYLGQSERTAHFGLGSYTSNITVHIFWPTSGVHTTVTNVTARQRINIIRPERNTTTRFSELKSCRSVEVSQLFNQVSPLNPKISEDKKAIVIEYSPYKGLTGTELFSYKVKVDPPLPPKYNLTDTATVKLHLEEDITSMPLCKSGRLVLPNMPPIVKTDERLLSGVSNNKIHLLWGAASTDLRRHIPSVYGDNISSPAGGCSKLQLTRNSCPYPHQLSGFGSTRPSPRTISNELFSQSKSIISNRRLSDFHSHYGQFLAHDTDFSSPLARFEFQGKLNEVWMPIKVPKGDLHFDLPQKGDSYLPFTRSTYNRCTGMYPKGLPRQQVNKITSIIDATSVYGNEIGRIKELRSFKDGKMRLSSDRILPSNDRGIANDNPVGRDPKRLKIAGDTRSNVQPGLIVLHSLFVREHNRLCDEYKKKKPQATDEEIFQYAKKIVIAEMQAILFREYIPATVGGMSKIPKYKGYNPLVDPSISNIFATAGFRFGHSQVNKEIFQLKPNGNVSESGHLLLRECYFNPEIVEIQGGIEPFLRGMIAFPAQEIDVKMVDEMRNVLFPVGRDNGLDLAAMNIQRGRDHGLPDYNTVRKSFQLKELTDFSEITKNQELAQKLKKLYGNINNVDLWVGGLAEDHAPGSELGPTFEKMFIDAFVRIRDGDRFWYEYYLSKEEIQMVHNLTLGTIIRLNSDFKDAPNDVFFASRYCKSVKDFVCQEKKLTNVKDLQLETERLDKETRRLSKLLVESNARLLKLKYNQKDETIAADKSTYIVIVLGVLFALSLIALIIIVLATRHQLTNLLRKLTSTKGPSKSSAIVFANTNPASSVEVGKK